MTSYPKPHPPPPRFALTVNEAGIALGVSRSTIYTLLRTGRLAFFRVGSDRRIPITAIEALARGER